MIFGNEAKGEDLKNFNLSLIHAIEAYLLTIYFILFFVGNEYFKKFHHQKFGTEKYVIPNFGVTTAILNHVRIFRRWCNFGLLQGQVKSRHFSWNNWQETKLENPFGF